MLMFLLISMKKQVGKKICFNLKFQVSKKFIFNLKLKTLKSNLEFTLSRVFNKGYCLKFQLILLVKNKYLRIYVYYYYIIMILF